MNKPEGYEEVLSEHGPVVFDGGCGEPVAWGFLLLCRIGEKRFDALASFGKLVCLSFGRWALVTKELTPKEAEAKYGSVSRLELGPRGGFRSATYGEKSFLSRRLDPRENQGAGS